MISNVSYDSRCYYVDGKPVWLVSGAMHYFRIPNELWEDRIAKAKLAGLNCIETYVAWNRHEPKEGVFDFSGDLDLDRFLTLMEWAGLYIIVRPGPYICSEWDNGAIPPWLTCKPGVRPRVNDPTYLAAVDSYFEQLLPIIEKHQVSRGGGVILVQNENEYLFPDRPGGKEYLEHLNRAFRQSGINVPIIVCNHLKLPIEDTIECWNAWDGITGGIDTLRTAQPGAPKLVTEFWDGWFEHWGMPQGQMFKSSASVFRRNCEILGSGAMWNYYMWHGGTNFGFYAGRTAIHSLGTITTSYDFGAPLSEAGQVTEKYLVTKTANWMARNWSRFLCEADPALPTASVDGPFLLQELKSDVGSLLVIRTQSDNQEEKLARVHLSDGTDLAVDLSDLGAAVMPVGIRARGPVGGPTVDYVNGSAFSTDPMIFFGPAGSDGVLSLDGEKVEFKYPQGDQPLKLETKSGDVFVMSTRGIERLWILEDGKMVFGSADFPAESGLVPRHGTETLLDMAGWTTYASFSILTNGGEWRAVDGPKSMDELGHYFGYGWYWCGVKSKQEKMTSLYFPKAGDRLLVFLNGQYIGTWGRGNGATPRPLPLRLKKGRNALVFLADNMGRANFGKKIGEPKGIWGEVGLGWQEVAHVGSTAASDGVPEEAKGQWELKTLWGDVPQTSRSVFWDVELQEGESLHLSIFDLSQYAYVLVNGWLAYHHVTIGSAHADLCYNEFNLEEFVHPGQNIVELRILDWQADALPDGVALYRYSKNAMLRGDWAFMPFDPRQAREGSGNGHPLRVHKTTFAVPSSPAPLFLNFSTLGKGQVYLNGIPLGRYWSIGPQERLYIPEPWLKETNELVIFEEEGKGPEGVTISGWVDPTAECGLIETITDEHG